MSRCHCGIVDLCGRRVAVASSRCELRRFRWWTPQIVSVRRIPSPTLKHPAYKANVVHSQYLSVRLTDRQKCVPSCPSHAVYPAPCPSTSSPGPRPQPPGSRARPRSVRLPTSARSVRAARRAKPTSLPQGRRFSTVAHATTHRENQSRS